MGYDFRINRRESLTTAASSPLVAGHGLWRSFTKKGQAAKKPGLPTKDFMPQLTLFSETIREKAIYHTMFQKPPVMNSESLARGKQLVRFIAGLDTNANPKDLRRQILDYSRQVFLSLSPETQKSILRKSKYSKPESVDKRRLDLLRVLKLISEEEFLKQSQKLDLHASN